jgi:hypothetical protein
MKTECCNNKINTNFSLLEWIFNILDFLFINDTIDRGNNILDELSLER